MGGGVAGVWRCGVQNIFPRCQYSSVPYTCLRCLHCCWLLVLFLLLFSLFSSFPLCRSHTCFDHHVCCFFVCLVKCFPLFQLHLPILAFLLFSLLSSLTVPCSWLSMLVPLPFLLVLLHSLCHPYLTEFPTFASHYSITGLRMLSPYSSVKSNKTMKDRR